MIVPVNVLPPLSVNVLPESGGEGNVSTPGLPVVHSGKLVADNVTLTGSSIVTVVAGLCGTVPTSLKVLPEVVIVNGSQVESIPVFRPVRAVVYTTMCVYVIP